MTLTDQHIDSLLEHCKKGNQLAQLEVYNRYQRAMYNVAVRIVKDTAEAEDIMQESFISAFNKLDTFKGTATFGSWLKRIVVNNSISQYKKQQRFIDIPDETIAETIEEASGIPEEDYTTDKAASILSCMETLHRTYHQILTLHLIEGYDYEEICEILDISYANCRTLMSRAKESLRKKLKIAS
ncbi:RNA polymerase sigma factor [Marixanthomonas spongiae]|uniref:RNA polymerase subunit sigma n=1 Tax=Marixanthomonas spongiae TaxID=2174845 RepID=A0A2U0I4I9_9FLAO|nr:RNA polymerase sigma factor [Marixanthomonas spongiae]PVW15900.1 RNA polymerase subunit sigma [Marixanthomonas spongiae]